MWGRVAHPFRDNCVALSPVAMEEERGTKSSHLSLAQVKLMDPERTVTAKQEVPILAVEGYISQKTGGSNPGARIHVPMVTGITTINCQLR